VKQMSSYSAALPTVLRLPIEGHYAHRPWMQSDLGNGPTTQPPFEGIMITTCRSTFTGVACLTR
jgi:hypothetical protein